MEQPAVRQKILVVDDEESYREIISLALQMMGFEIIEAVNGLDGLGAAKLHHPDLILCDINMPKMDGQELLRTLRDEPEFAGIPFIFLTGNSGTDDLRKGMQLGADDYLTKPFTTVELQTAVETRLTKNRKIRKFYESQFDEIKSNIVLSLPHEFRTPMNSILGFSQILMEDEHQSPEELKEIGSMINKSGRRLHHLLENMVLFGQMQIWEHDRKKMRELCGESTTLVEVVNATADHQMEKHHRKNAIQTTIEECFVQISSLYLGKIIEEILDNALKFSEAGTAVYLSGKAAGKTVDIVVRDEGRGLSEEQVGKISGFRQFDRAYYEQQGAGLGLAVAKKLAELHGGGLSLESKEKIGTTVRVSLPLVNVE